MSQEPPTAAEVVQPDVSEESPQSEHWIWVGRHRPPVPRALLELMSSHWQDDSTHPTPRHPAAENFAARRSALSAAFQGTHLVIPTGPPRIRSNDTDYRFRPATDFFYLTGAMESDCVLVMEAAPQGDGHSATLYVAPRSDRSSHEFFTDARHGELWVGRRLGLPETEAHLGITTAPLAELDDHLARLTSGGSPAVLRRGVDPRLDEQLLGAIPDTELRATLAAMRLVKDDYEVEQLQHAVDATVRGFEDVVRALPDAMERGERIVESTFAARSRLDGNDTGYQPIAASGAHATILHWSRNDGDVNPGDLLLLDAGVECRQLYTADVTRTLPVSGTFTPAQRQVYELVYAAQQAAIAEVKPGAPFLAPHRAATRVLAEGLHALGILGVDPEVAIRLDRQLHRRWTLHGTSHMLGLDVHDCNDARDEQYHGDLRPGYVLTVEPGLYFQPDDLTVPPHLRGIGVRIEDDVLVTEDGHRVLSAALPRHPDEVERWMASLSVPD
ncbi:MAG: aminopeptidase P family protein [Candidatus Dormibacteria bacterium]